MRALSKATFIVLCAFLSVGAIAGDATGTVTRLFVRQTDGLTFFYLSGTATGQPACATMNYWIIQDENSEAGKKLYALVMAAQISNREIKVVGANTCTRWGDGEDVKYIELR